MGTSYAAYQTPVFPVVAGTHVIEFLGLAPASADSTAFIEAVSLSPVSDAIAEGNFVVPALAAGAYQLAPAGSSWRFSADAGISNNGSAASLTAIRRPPLAVELIKDGGSMTQTAYLDAGVHNISFQAAQRAISRRHAAHRSARQRRAPVSTITPPGADTAACQTANFSVTAGAHTIEFLGLARQRPTAPPLSVWCQSRRFPARSPTAASKPVAGGRRCQLDPGGSPWIFAGASGVSGNGSTFTGGNTAAPEGDQVALIKNTGGISQSIYLSSGEYSISFDAAQRAISQSQYQEIEVLVDGSVVAMTEPSSTSYGLCQTPLFSVSAGPHTIEFLGLNPQGGDNTAFLDDVQVLSS